jgi:ligand-binding sensor domain-containing protein
MSAVRFLLALLVTLIGSPLIAQESVEQWQHVELPAPFQSSEIVGLGQARFPDGLSGPWFSTASVMLRQVGGQWQRWPDFDDDPPTVRTMLVAPDSSGKTAWWLGTDQGLWLSRDGEIWQQYTSENSPLADDRILSLLKHQTRAQGHEIWVGTARGLNIWRPGGWEVVLARPDGFQGGAVRELRRLVVDDQRQIWAVGPDGISRHINRHWQRIASDCLRGHLIHDLETLDHPEGLRLAVATSRGLILLDPQSPDQCTRMTPPDRSDTEILMLGRDTQEQLYLFSAQRVDRVFATRYRDDTRFQWTFFDHRDGLTDTVQWTGGIQLATDGLLLAGSQRGLWQLQTATEKERHQDPMSLQLEYLGTNRIADPGDSFRVSSAQPRFEVLTTQSPRSHSTRFRYRLGEEPHSGWKTLAAFQPDMPAYGSRALEIQLLDEFGHQHGPYHFTLKRSTLWISYSAIVAIAIVLTITVTLVRRRSLRKPAA